MTKTELAELLQKGESTSLDWKADFPPALPRGRQDPGWDESRGKVLRSLVALANSEGEQHAYLVYGVKDLGSSRQVLGISRSFDDADFQTWAENTFDPPPTFSYTEIEWNPGQTVGVFQISRTANYPHVVATTIGNIIFEGQVWFRRGTKNTVALRADLECILRGEEPFKISDLDDPVLQKVIEHYKNEGRETRLPRFTDRDSLLARGYELARYPGTRREIWVGNVGDRYEHILVLKPKGPP